MSYSSCNFLCRIFIQWFYAQFTIPVIGHIVIMQIFDILFCLDIQIFFQRERKETPGNHFVALVFLDVMYFLVFISLLMIDNSNCWY